MIPDEECNDVVSFNLEFIEELDFLHGSIAVGDDGGGNPYVILTESGKEGVYYWDRTHLHEADPANKFDIAERNDSGNLFFITPSFKSFHDKVISSIVGPYEYLEES